MVFIIFIWSDVTFVLMAQFFENGEFVEETLIFIDVVILLRRSLLTLLHCIGSYY